MIDEIEDNVSDQSDIVLSHDLFELSPNEVSFEFNAQEAFTDRHAEPVAITPPITKPTVTTL
jgi:hypothetical protein